MYKIIQTTSLYIAISVMLIIALIKGVQNLG